jgi:hypothetical protein
MEKRKEREKRNNKSQMSKMFQSIRKKNTGIFFFIQFSTLEELIFKLNDEDHSEDEGI